MRWRNHMSNLDFQTSECVTLYSEVNPKPDYFRVGHYSLGTEEGSLSSTGWNSLM
jgi:hypothetical protein